MKILMICGTYPPERCGIGDYLHNIVGELKKDTNYQVEVLANINWSNGNIFSIIKKVKFYQADIIHIQYPSQSYGLSFVPHLLSVRFKCLVTIHEVSHSKLLRRLSLFFFSLRSRIIFTNIFEYKNFRNLFPWYRKPAIIIPIGSNVTINESNTVSIDAKINANRIVYFGQIRPKKGIEDLLELGKLLSIKNSPLKVLIMGEVLPAFKDYWKTLQNDERYSYAQFKLNVSFEEINDILSRSTFAYLPFPDGVSERRGSMFAAFANKIPVITTKGIQTTTEIENIVDIAESPNEVLTIINEGVDKMYNRINARKSKIEDFLSNHSWKEITKKHKMLYQQIGSL